MPQVLTAGETGAGAAAAWGGGGTSERLARKPRPARASNHTTARETRAKIACHTDGTAAQQWWVRALPGALLAGRCAQRGVRRRAAGAAGAGRCSAPWPPPRSPRPPRPRATPLGLTLSQCGGCRDRRGTRERAACAGSLGRTERLTHPARGPNACVDAPTLSQTSRTTSRGRLGGCQRSRLAPRGGTRPAPPHLSGAWTSAVLRGWLQLCAHAVVCACWW